MKELLCCPTCGAGFCETGGDSDDWLECANHHRFPIHFGIPIFVDTKGRDDLFFEAIRKAPSLELSTKSPALSVEYLTRKEFFLQTGMDLEALKGKYVLDAGCGGGRFLSYLAAHGVNVIGLDLSFTGVLNSTKCGFKYGAGAVVGDIFQPPFKPHSFDFIYSLGVLHHTPNPQRAFESLTNLVKPGGKIAVWVYPKPKFKFLSDYLRVVTTQLPPRVLLFLSFLVTAPYGPFLRIPWLGERLSKFLKSFRLPWHGDWTWRRHSFMDWYGPKYQFKYSPDDLLCWFSKLQLTDLRIGDYASSMTGTVPQES